MLDRFGHHARPLPLSGSLGERAARLVVLLAALAASPAHAQGDFGSWLAGFRQEAAEQGISSATLDAALTGVTPDERVIALDRRQPEFLQTFSDYLRRRVTDAFVAQGQALLAEHAALLDAVEQQYGVPKTVLVAFWGLETRYGAVQGDLNVPASLATLAWEGRRSGFFRGELLDALRIIDAGHVSAHEMTGSWAGAMGQMQFMPSTFRAYAVDGDGDGRIDVWHSLPDAMDSAAHYLQRAGWRAHAPVAIEVRLPEGFDWRQARVFHRLQVAEWTAMGVAAADGSVLPEGAGRAGIVLPQGWQGPAFMVFDNFDVVMKWNRSQNYALTVAQLASQLAGGHAVFAGGGEPGALSVADFRWLQQALDELGYDAGTPDGFPGPRTQTAVRLYQALHRLPVDGYAGPSLLAHVRQAHAEAAAAGTLVLAPPPTFAGEDEAP
ncbi:lytic murein transglycosylase [Thiobacillus sedimenti]|uniref:Lytic murein transglycosylase n=1 Tax=Thiobacillus sedimenti TaxID=3110231 RepID=A0ABZ1CIX0_9PROT|nr:lytic murein transglycosylase [Thiobacillus sp. SCUT-2]WRS39346.1 lytic murein transglycosylase [Thiobacillus sp. SCUT-2]